MRRGEASSPNAIDVVYPLQGQTLRRDHAQELRQILGLRLPWLESDNAAGIHPIKLVPGNDDPGLLSSRARLLLRVSPQRFEKLIELAGSSLLMTGSELRLGLPHERKLLPHATLYAHRVAASSPDELEFLQAVSEELEQLGIKGHRVCGKHQTMTLGRQELNCFSLMLHALAPSESLRLQELGLGAHRLLGCGIFVPHKSAAAVGA